MLDLTVIELAADIALGVVCLGLGVFVWAALKLRAIYIDGERDRRRSEAILMRPFTEEKIAGVTRD